MTATCPKCGEFQPGQLLHVEIYRSVVSECYEAWIPHSNLRGTGKTPTEAVANLFMQQPKD